MNVALPFGKSEAVTLDCGIAIWQSRNHSLDTWHTTRTSTCVVIWSNQVMGYRCDTAGGNRLHVT